MNTTGTVLFVRAARAEGGGPGALEAEFDVIVAEGAIDAMKRLSSEPEAPDCLVAPASVPDLSLDAFLSRVDRTAPDTAVLVVGELPADTDAAAAVVEADAYVPPGREAVLADRVRRLLGERRMDRAIDRHDRLARTVMAVAVDVTEATDRGEVESIVHDRLIEGNGYRHVWIASHDDDGDLDVSVPVTGRLGEEEVGDLVGGGDPAFVARAIDTGRVVSTEGHVPTRSAAATANTAAINDGGETRTLATAAVPFVHDGRILGVGLVSTERPDALDGSERELLSDLGAIVGHALWALESGRDSSAPDFGRGMENLVHDLRNPLGIARTHLQIAREDDDPESLDRAESALERVTETIDRVAEGVGGELQADATTNDLAEVARAAWASVEVPPASLEVDESPTIRADRDLLVRLFANLFQNSIDHGGESVTVRIGGLSDGFYVEDDGPGVPPEERESVFERGYSTSTEGLGIGLSIVQDVANAHGWSVSVTDAEAGGARFEVTGVEAVEDARPERSETG